MGNQMTEMLKGTLEGIVLAILAAQPAYGYEITARLREQGFADLVEGTVYALLVRIEQRGFVDVERSRPRRARRARCTRSTRRGANSSQSSGGPGASSQNASNSSTTPNTAQKERTDMAAKWIETLTGSLEQKKQYKQDKARIEALPEPYRTTAKAFHRYLMYYGGVSDGDTLDHDVRRLRRPLGARRRRRDAGARRSSATTRSSSPRRSRRPTPASSGSTRSAPA